MDPFQKVALKDMHNMAGWQVVMRLQLLTPVRFRFQLHSHMRIGIIGTGYVGLVTGLCFGELGHKVTFVDIDNKKISGLRKGKIDFYEPNLNKLINKSLKKENILLHRNMMFSAIQE